MAKLSKKLTEQRESALAAVTAITAKAEAENRDLTSSEKGECDAHSERAGRLSVEITTARDAEQARKAEKAAEARTANGLDTVTPDNASGIHVKTSERTYRKNGEHNYFMDLASRAAGKTAPAQRLARYAQEVSVDAQEADARIKAGSARDWKPGQVADEYLVRQARSGMQEAGVGELHARTGDLSTTATAGGDFVVPQYDTADWVRYARPGRVYADACHKLDLKPGGMSILVPKVTTGAVTASQATQNTAIEDSAAVTATTTVPIVTIAGQQSVSQQIIDRADIDFVAAISEDLNADLAREVDYQVINGSGSSGQLLGSLNTTGITSTVWSEVSPTYELLWAQIASTKGSIASTRFLPATHMFMTPDWWEYLESSFDSNGRPLIVPTANGPFNAVQVVQENAVAEGLTGGTVLGLAVNQDFNIPANLGSGTNESHIVVARMDDQWLWEGPLMARALPQTLGNQLTVLLQVWEYAAFTAARYPKSMGAITGTGTIVPAFAL
jgi:HK97 family phage major capsid protein